jgi:PadR family transcriptional regulator AphA
MMELRDVILGFLERTALTGYELKGMFSKFDFLPWSGNNNQIYTTLLELEKGGLVKKQIIQQEKLPAQKRYSATEAGKRRLREAVLQPSVAPGYRNDFLLRLAWAECLSTDEITAMIDDYQRIVETELIMSKENIRRREGEDSRSDREGFVWKMILQNEAMALQNELSWLAQLKDGLANSRLRKEGMQ